MSGLFDSAVLFETTSYRALWQFGLSLAANLTSMEVKEERNTLLQMGTVVSCGLASLSNKKDDKTKNVQYLYLKKIMALQKFGFK